MNTSIRDLTSQLDVLKKYLFGRRTETSITDAGSSQYSFKVNAYNELEVTLDEASGHQEPAVEKIVPKAYTRKKTKGKRASIMAQLSRQKIEVFIMN